MQLSITVRMRKRRRSVIWSQTNFSDQRRAREGHLQPKPLVSLRSREPESHGI